MKVLRKGLKKNKEMPSKEESQEESQETTEKKPERQVLNEMEIMGTFQYQILVVMNELTAGILKINQNLDAISHILDDQNKLIDTQSNDDDEDEEEE